NLEFAERLVEILDPQGGLIPGGPIAGHWLPAWPARSRAISQSVRRASGMVITTKTKATAMYGVKLNLAALMIDDSRKISTTPSVDTRTVSFCSPMKSLRSGGITRRTACGTITKRSAWRRLRPSDRAAASWLQWTDSIPAR